MTDNDPDIRLEGRRAINADGKQMTLDELLQEIKKQLIPYKTLCNDAQARITAANAAERAAKNADAPPEE